MTRSTELMLLGVIAFMLTAGADCDGDAELRSQLKKALEAQEHERQQKMQAQEARKRAELEAKAERTRCRQEVSVEKTRREWSDCYALCAAGALVLALLLLSRMLWATGERE